MKVFISACGEGFGHSSRMIALYRELEEKGHRATVACYGMALKRLKEEGIKTLETFPEVRMVGAHGRFDLARSMFYTSRYSPNIMRAFLTERAYIRKHDIDFVVSDSRIVSKLVALHLKKPVFYVTNQTSFLPYEKMRRPELKTLLKLLGGGREHLLYPLFSRMQFSLPYELCDAILIPDFAPPETISLQVLSRDMSVKKKTHFAGPFSILCGKNVQPAGWRSEKTKVLVMLGGQEFRKGELRRIVEQLRGSKYDVLVSSAFVETEGRLGNVVLKKYLPRILPYMGAADILVMPAGHSALMESIIMKKPALLLPDEGQLEQQANARQYEKLGLGKTLGGGELSHLLHALAKIEEDYDSHVRKLESLSRRAKNRDNGARNCVRMMGELEARVASY